MRETPEEIAELQRMFDVHLARANPHMTAIVTPERRLTAEQVVRYLQGIRHVAFATVTPRGQLRASPLDTPWPIRPSATSSSNAYATASSTAIARPC
jgi:hypothetical protein